MLPVDQYAVVKSALVDRATKKMRENTPFDQRMADALVAVCKGDPGADDRSGRAGGMRRNRPTMVVHADFSFLAGGTGAAELDVLGPSPPRWRGAWRATPRSSSRVTGQTVARSTSAARGEIRPTRNESSFADATRAAGFPDVRTSNSRTSTTSGTGSTAGQPTSTT